MNLSKYNFKKLTNEQLGYLYALADEAISCFDVSWEEEDGSTNYVMFIPEGHNFDHFAGIRVEAKRTLVNAPPVMSQVVTQMFSQITNVRPTNVVVQRIRVDMLLHLNVRGTPEGEIITVKV